MSYPRSVAHPFHGDYIRLRQNIQWKRVSCEHNDQYVVFADIINKIARSSGKVSGCTNTALQIIRRAVIIVSEHIRTVHSDIVGHLDELNAPAGSENDAD